MPPHSYLAYLDQPIVRGERLFSEDIFGSISTVPRVPPYAAEVRFVRVAVVLIYACARIFVGPLLVWRGATGTRSITVPSVPLDSRGMRPESLTPSRRSHAASRALTTVSRAYPPLCPDVDFAAVGIPVAQIRCSALDTAKPGDEPARPSVTWIARTSAITAQPWACPYVATVIELSEPYRNHLIPVLPPGHGVCAVGKRILTSVYASSPRHARERRRAPARAHCRHNRWRRR
jgi:hypothetical protein